jgi:hypothetical protein
MLKKMLTVLAASVAALGITMGAAQAATPTLYDNCVSDGGLVSTGCNNTSTVTGLPLVGGLLGSQGGLLGAGVLPFHHRRGFFPGGGFGWSPYLEGSYLNGAAFGFNQVEVCPSRDFGAFSGTWRPRFGGRWPGFERTMFGLDRGGWGRSFGALRAQACGGSSVIAEPYPVAVPVPAYEPGGVSCGCAAPAAYFPSEPQNNRINEVPQSAPSAGDSGLAPDAVRVH